MAKRKIVAISDQHGHLYPETLPEADLLLVAGDVAPSWHGPRNPGKEQERQDEWMPEWLKWVQSQPVKTWLGVWGNHDYATDKYHGFAEGLVSVQGVRIWCSPWSNEFCGWNWMQPPEKLAEYYAQIPDHVDIIMSHQPPYGYGDLLEPRMRRAGEDPHVGSKELLEVVERLEPEAVICGHIHSGHGQYCIDRHGVVVTTVYNVALVDEMYRPIYQPTVFEIEV